MCLAFVVDRYQLMLVLTRSGKKDLTDRRISLRSRMRGCCKPSLGLSLRGFMFEIRLAKLCNISIDRQEPTGQDGDIEQGVDWDFSSWLGR